MTRDLGTTKGTKHTKNHGQMNSGSKDIMEKAVMRVSDNDSADVWIPMFVLFVLFVVEVKERTA